MKTLLLGQTLRFTGDPFLHGWDTVTRTDSAGGVLIEDGRITAIGHGADLKKDHPQAQVHDHGSALIAAGFVDAHMHYPQTAMIASWGKQLIDWLNTYTFPEEAKFADPAYAAEVAGRTLDLALAHGTTTLTSFCTIHPASVDAVFEAAAQRGMAMIAGKTCMDRNAPDDLRDTAQSAYDDSKALLDKWHGKGRATYAITPRFSPTSTSGQLGALGALWAERPEALMQTHLSEQHPEIAWVRDLSPAPATTSTPTRHTAFWANAGFTDMRSIWTPARWTVSRKPVPPSSIARPPTHSSARGSLTWRASRRAAIRTGLATDTGGGSSFSMLRTMAAAYEIGQLRGTALHPAQLMWLATEGSARALHLGGQIGHLGVGAMADITVLDLASTPAIAQRSALADTLWDALFPTIMMGDDRAVKAVYVAGQQAVSKISTQ